MSKHEELIERLMSIPCYVVEDTRAIVDAADALEAQAREIEGLRKDAERYRWLRIQPNDATAPRIDICHWTCDDGDSVNNGEGLRGDAADEAIDAAMKGSHHG